MLSNNINFKIPDETVDKAYDDALHPFASESGKLLGRLPRAINAALAPLDEWILKKELNLAQTKQALENKLSSADPDKIVPPEPYVAVPALQYIPYSISNEELYNLYANLLSKAMYSDTKENVHPSFVEIIKQLSPIDALVLKEFTKSNNPVAAATLSIILKISGMHIVGQKPEERTSSDLVADIRISGLTEQQIQISLDNLKRLGLISLLNISLSDSKKYDFVKKTELYARFQHEFDAMNQFERVAERIRINGKVLSLSSIGELFCDICILGFN